MRAFIIWIIVCGVLAAQPAKPGLPASGGNRHYTGNRAPLQPSPLIKLPVGHVQPRGWLKIQLDLMAEGYTGRLPELSRFCKFEGNAWTNPKGEGSFGWEEVPYWLKGFVNLGYLTGNARIQEESKRWLEAVLRTQADNGYFGSLTNLEDAAAGAKVLDLWPNMVMLYPLRTYFEASGDKRVLDFMTRYFRWMNTLPLEKIFPGSWQKWRAGDNLDSIYWLYNRTGEAWLLDLARVNHERTADWVGDIPTWHGVNLSQCFREPAQYFQQTRDPRYLKASERLLDTVMALYGQPGGMFAADENARPGFAGPRQAAESCSMVELMHSYEMLMKISGSAPYGDKAEEIAFNSLPASMTPDLKALHYLTAANMVQLDRGDKSPLLQNRGDQLSYNPYQYRCCQHNVAFGWPYFAEHAWMATQNHGLAAALYAPSFVKAKVAGGAEVAIEEETGYPFEESVTFKIAPSRAVAFPLALRLPAWCTSPRLSLNGSEVAVPANAGGWITLHRVWRPGDTVKLELPMQVRVRAWDRISGSQFVQRGPLTYSLKISERWQKYSTASENWPAFEVFPNSPWNYALDASQPITLEKRPLLPGQPFTPDTVPLMLKAKGRRVPQWIQEPNGLVGEIQPGPVRTLELEEELTLIPMGAARLRISVFPAYSASGREWDPNPPLATASSASHFQPPSAMNDGQVGATSADPNTPWFIWGDAFGATEWAQYTFSRPRRISKVAVFWAAEEITRNSGRVPSDLRFAHPSDGTVQLPASWRLLWWDGQGWQTVKANYSAERDKFNEVTFEPITTTRLRIEVEQQRGKAAGIVEWRIE